MEQEQRPDDRREQVETTNLAGRVYEIRALQPIADRLPTEHVPVSQLQEAVGKGNTYWFDRNGRDLGPYQLLVDWETAIKNPASADHIATINRADLTRPIWIYQDGTVFDGIHRLTRAVRDDVKQIPIKRFAKSDLPKTS